VLVVVVPGVPKLDQPEQIVLAEPFEWEPRARCYQCKNIESRSRVCPKCRGFDLGCARCEGTGTVSDKRANCNRCGGEGYIGKRRPTGVMLAIDIAWSDDGHVRLVEPTVSRRKGEALYELHDCSLA
jgi:RecJ-like exonuclease